MWLVWRIALGPVLLKHKVWCRHPCKMKLALARHLLEDVDFTRSVTRPLKVLRLCVRGWDAASFTLLENRFEGGRWGRGGG